LRLDYCLKDPFPHEIWAGDPLNVNTPLHEPATETRISGGTELREWARLNGFAVPPLQEGRDGGRRYYYFDLVKARVPTLENITPDTSLMLRPAAEFACTYEGWSCETVG
jgi:hypothetical protein